MPEDWVGILGQGGLGAGIAYAGYRIALALISRKRDDTASGANAELTQAQADQVQADAASALAQSSIKIIESVRRDAEQEIARVRRDTELALERATRDIERSRMDSDEARRSAQEAWDEAAKARREAMDAAATIRRVTTEVLAPRPPEVIVERLKQIVGGESGRTYSGLNGTG
jgi:hypothetical protein